MRNAIKIHGAKEHNLKNISIDLPRNKLIVVTGPSGSGKSSLVFDTIHEESQRRYLQSLSIYARQFIGNLSRPAVDDISGLPPTVSVEQRGVSHNPRSTVGTVTDIYDHLRILYGSIGVPHCLSCGDPISALSLDEIVSIAYEEYGGKLVEILSPLARKQKEEFTDLFSRLRAQGFVRVRIDGKTMLIEERLSPKKKTPLSVELVVDRVRLTAGNASQISESIETALQMSDGFVVFSAGSSGEREFTNRALCPRCHLSAPTIEPRLFSFNSPIGACPLCSGLGVVLNFTPDHVVDWDLPLAEGGFPFWKNNKHTIPKAQILAEIHSWDLSLPLKDLPEAAKKALLYGTDELIPWVYRDGSVDKERVGNYEALIPWLERKFIETESESLRTELKNCHTESKCPACNGLRLKPEALAVTVGSYSIADLTEMTVKKLLKTLGELSLDGKQGQIAAPLLQETQDRVAFLNDTGVDYITLSRRADSLSGGETQRIRLATQIGARLFGVLYLLDEPTIGLHPRDTERLLQTLEKIRDDGNSIMVVEHDRDTMLRADYIVELGPSAGSLGGEIVSKGTLSEIKEGRSSTASYIAGDANGVYRLSKKRIVPQSWIRVRGCREHNLKNIDVKVPCGVFCVLSGVSGSGKSTFLHEILYKGLKSQIDNKYKERTGVFDDIVVDGSLKDIILIDQTPIGRTPRSNPATYIGAFAAIRDFYAMLPEAKIRGYATNRFSFNVKGGRCEACRGEGVLKVTMLFLPDVHVACDVCGGKRYNKETLEVRYKGLSIADVLDLTVDEATIVFESIPKIFKKLRLLQEAGLGYIQLGQSALTLSGGEAQRVKLADELGKQTHGKTLYLLDEPTAGLYYTDVKKLLVLIQKLVSQGNSVVMIEHNQDVLASADYILDLGPGGGDEGGELIACGTPEEIAKTDCFTGKYLARYLKKTS